MVGPPPPPPPGPPPPPAFSLSKSNDSAPEARSALLQSIQKGAKLKKTVTVDKSGPSVSGRVAGSSTNTAPKTSNHSSNTNSNNNSSSNNNIGNDGPKLGGIFGGMSTMPKLKPVGSRGVPTANRSPPNERAPDTSPPTVSQSVNVNSSGPLDFSSELQKTLTLKRQRKENNGLSLSNQETTTLTTSTPSRPSIVNRGPPPQPPASKNLPNSTSDSILGRSNLTTSNTVSASTPSLAGNGSTLYNKAATQQTKSTTSMTDGTSTKSLNSTHGLSIAPNKSSLFNNSNSNTDSNSNTIINDTSKPVPNYGKPNLAPKPPGVNGNNRPISRHHSMKTPRSPTTNEGMSFPATNHFGTIRGPPQYQSSESINAGRSIGRPTMAPPPRPPPTKPPPPPARNLTQPIMPLSNLGGSVGTLNNNNTLKNNGTNMGSVNNINGNGNAAPPPPPHRTCPPPPGSRQANNVSGIGVIPPAPPQRISSKHRGAPAGPVIINNNNTAMSNAVNRIIMDLESKFAHNFHNVTEFPKPQQFLNINKIYPSQQNVKSVNEIRKSKAPSPPNNFTS